MAVYCLQKFRAKMFGRFQRHVCVRARKQYEQTPFLHMTVVCTTKGCSFVFITAALSCIKYKGFYTKRGLKMYMCYFAICAQSTVKKFFESLLVRDSALRCSVHSRGICMTKGCNSGLEILLSPAKTQALACLLLSSTTPPLFILIL